LLRCYKLQLICFSQDLLYFCVKIYVGISFELCGLKFGYLLEAVFGKPVGGGGKGGFLCSGGDWMQCLGGWWCGGGGGLPTLGLQFFERRYQYSTTYSSTTLFLVELVRSIFDYCIIHSVEWQKMAE
jgi:hypothetical protein